MILHEISPFGQGSLDISRMGRLSALYSCSSHGLGPSVGTHATFKTSLFSEFVYMGTNLLWYSINGVSEHCQEQKVARAIPPQEAVSSLG